jgi:protein TonB
MRLSLPEAPGRRALLVGLLCSLLLHVVLIGAAVLWNQLWPPVYVKRGEPLLVDIAPERPAERAPRGSLSDPPARPTPPAARRAEAPPAPPVRPPAPRVPAPRPAPPPAAKPEPAPAPPVAAPASAPEVARAQPPEPPPVPVPSPPPASRPSEPPAVEPSPGARPAPSSPEPPALAPPPGAAPGLGRPRLDLPAAMLRRPPGGGTQGGRGGIEGEPVPLDTPDPRYKEYFDLIREKIRRNWGYPREAADRGIEGQLLIEFHIARSGQLEYIELRRTSGVGVLDEYALNAIRLAQPFPPVPEPIAKNVLAISGLFRYQIVTGSSLLNQILR